MGLILGVTAIALLRDEDQPRAPVVAPTPTLAATTGAGPTATNAVPQVPTAEPPVATAEPTREPTKTPTERAAVACPERCLVRLAAPDEASVGDLEAAGIQPAYVGGGQLWGAADRQVIERMVADGAALSVVLPDADTLPLYVVRFRETADERTAGEIGEVVDRVDRLVLVRADVLPPPIADLATRGIAVEKVPPPGSSLEELPGRARLDDATDLVAAVSDDELERTIRELQAIDVAPDEFGSRGLGDRGNTVAADYLFRRMAELGMSVRYDDFVGDNGAYATNVVGELPGADRSRVLLVLAHYDSLNAEGGPSPGAEDNASGVAAMMEIARALSRYRLPYPVQFAALSGEEVGFQGTRVFVSGIGDTNYVGAFNLDAVGSPVRPQQLVVNGGENSVELLSLLDRVNTEFEIGEGLLLRQNEFIVADDDILRANGIPAVLIARALYGESDVHHTSDDVIENMNVHSVGHAATLVLLSLVILLNE